MKFHEIFYETQVDEISWNFIIFHETFHEISWNFMTSRNYFRQG
jgi:hypothetical protein